MLVKIGRWLVAPSRARGSKLDRVRFELRQVEGRALTGAWIETVSCEPLLGPVDGRALMGAWIET